MCTVSPETVRNPSVQSTLLLQPLQYRFAVDRVSVVGVCFYSRVTFPLGGVFQESIVSTPVFAPRFSPHEYAALAAEARGRIQALRREAAPPFWRTLLASRRPLRHLPTVEA